MSELKLKQYEELLKVKLVKPKYPFVVKNKSYIVKTLKTINLTNIKSGGGSGIITVITN